MNVVSFFRRYLSCLPYGGAFDKFYVFLIFLYAHRRLPRRNSELFNDYLYFLKTSPEILDVFRQMTSDKIIVKDFVDRVCGHSYTIETYGVFERVDEINLSRLPSPCVLKPAHSSGSVVFVGSGQDSLSREQEFILNYALLSSPYKAARELNYKHLRPRLICEPMLPSAQLTKDYKFFCYKGVPKLVQVDSERHSDHKRNIYTADWEPVDIQYNFASGNAEPAPSCLSGMKDIASRLASPFEFVRVDFFLSGDSFYVGEITHCPESAHGRFGDLTSERTFSKILFSEESPK